MSQAVLSLSEAKATLSSVIQRVDDYGESVIIKRHNKPVARIVPFAHSAKEPLAGSLSKYAKRGISEEGALAEAMVNKHAANR